MAAEQIRAPQTCRCQTGQQRLQRGSGHTHRGRSERGRLHFDPGGTPPRQNVYDPLYGSFVGGCVPAVSWAGGAWKCAPKCSFATPFEGTVKCSWPCSRRPGPETGNTAEVEGTQRMTTPVAPRGPGAPCSRHPARACRGSRDAHVVVVGRADGTRILCGAHHVA